MKKMFVALVAASFAVTGVYADLYAAMAVDWGITGNGAEGGIVDDVLGTEIVATVVDANGTGLNFGSTISYTDGVLNLTGDDSLVGTFSLTITETGAFQNEAFGLSGTIGGEGTALPTEAYIVVSGLANGDWVWVGQAGVDFVDFEDKDFSGSQPPSPQAVLYGFDGDGADGSITVIPEPATIGLMGIAGLGMFLARRKVRR